MLFVIVGSVTMVAVKYQRISEKITESLDGTEGKSLI